MKALIAMSLFIFLASCTKRDGKGGAQGDDATDSATEGGTTETGAGGSTGSPDNENYGGKNDKDVKTETGTTGSNNGTTTGSGNDSGTGTGNDSGTGTGNDSGGTSGGTSGNDSGNSPSTTADTDTDGVTDDKDVCPGENDALQATRYKLTDADNDSYADGSLSATVCPSNTEYTLTLPQVVYNDCNSSDATKWQTLAYSHRDADGDGHSIASAGSICSGSALPSGYLENALGTTDCDDTNNSYHTITTYYSYTADAITPDRYSRLSESKCIPTDGYGAANAYKEYRLVPTAIAAPDLIPVLGLYKFDGRLFFQGYSSTHGVELWATDGTLAGTTMIKDINSGSADSYPDNFISASNTLFFTVDLNGSGPSHLWKTDGTEAGTVQVKAISPSSLTVSNGVLYFVAKDGTSGFELWKTDGTEAGTTVVKNINTAFNGSSSPASLTDVNGTLFFIANDGTGVRNLWKSDGTAAGTVKVKDLDNYSGSEPSDLIAVGGTLFFTANINGYGRELWKSDGTEAGTVLVKDIRVGNGDGFVSSTSSQFATVNGLLYFVADDGTSHKELWKSDGTEAGTVMVKDIWAGSSGSMPNNLINLNGTLFFTADNGTYGTELWKSDGSEAGTVMVKDIKTGGSINLQYPKVVENILYFRTDDGIHGPEVWKSDGTESGTLLVKDINEMGSSNPEHLAVFNNQLVFVASTADSTQIYLMPEPL